MKRYNPWKKVWERDGGVIITGVVFAILAAVLLLSGCYIGAGSPVTAGWNADSSKPQTAAVEAVFDSSTAAKEYDFPIYEPEVR